MKPKKRPTNAASIVGPCYKFLFENLNARKPKPPANTILTRVSRILIALAGFIELINKSIIMNKFTKTRTPLMPPEMYMKTLAPKKLLANPKKSITKASKIGLFLKKLRMPCMLNTGQPAACVVLIVNVQVLSSAVTVKSLLVGVPSLVESQYISKYVPQEAVPQGTEFSKYVSI